MVVRWPLVVAVVVAVGLVAVPSSDARPKKRRPPVTTTTVPTSSTTTTAPTTTTTVPTTTTTQPSSAVGIPAGTTIQSTVNGYPAGTVFRLGAGVHWRQTVTPRTGDVFLLADGAVLDGDGVAYAFTGNASDVTIRAEGVGVVRRYNPPTDPQAAVGGFGTHWTVDGLELTGITGGAAARLTSNGLLRNLNIHDNPGKVGVTAYQIADGRIEGGRIVNSNSARLYDPYWDAAGMKLVDVDRVVVSGVEAGGNWGPGVWCDIACTDWTVENSYVHDNKGVGIFYEVSRRATIRNNRVHDNGGSYGGGWAIHQANILISHSPDVEVYGNDVRGGSLGIIGWQDDRHEQRAWQGDNASLRNLWVHDNRIGPVALHATGVGVLNIDPAYGHTAGDYFTSLGNRFDWNTYEGVTLHRFTPDGANLSRAQWQQLGQDPNGIWL
jgi:parallel beta-helix repeat protein